jgi:hypothetical protein
MVRTERRADYAHPKKKKKEISETEKSLENSVNL